MREMSTEAEWGTASHLAGAEDAGESAAAAIREAENVGRGQQLGIVGSLSEEVSVTEDQEGRDSRLAQV